MERIELRRRSGAERAALAVTALVASLSVLAGVLMLFASAAETGATLARAKAAPAASAVVAKAERFE